MPTTSHAKCSQCGSNRHKIARMNMCRACWLQRKAEMRAHWRDIKSRRAERRQREHRMVLDQLTESPLESIVPPIGTPERAQYMRSFIKRDGTGKSEHLERHALDVIRLYEDPRVPVDKLKAHFGVGNAMLSLFLKKHGVVPRTERPDWHRTRAYPPGHLGIIDGEVQWMEDASATAKPMPVATQPAPPQATPSERAQEWIEHQSEEPQATKPAKPAKRRSWPQHIRDEVIALYTSSPDIPIYEICRTYDMPNGTLYRLLYSAGVYKSAEERRAQAAAPKEEPMPIVDALPAPPLAMLPDQANGHQALPEHGWMISYVVRRNRVVSASTIDQALEDIRQALGRDIEVVAIQRA